MSWSQRAIERIDIRPVTIELTEPFAIAGGAPDQARNVFVRVTLRDGSTGYGGAAPLRRSTGRRKPGPGRPAGREGRGHRPRRGRVAIPGRRRQAPDPRRAGGRCAIEQAVIDALARHVGLPLLQFFGGCSHDLTTDITIPAGDIAHSASSAQRAVQDGFGTVKVKVGAGAWESDGALKANRAAPGISIVADANEGYSYPHARQFLDRVRSAGVALALMEQPVAADDVASLAALEEEFRIPVCADESARSPADAIRVARAGQIGVINIKLMKCGVSDALDMISVARAAGMSCMIGGMIETAVSMTFSAALAMANYPLFAYTDLDTPLFMQNSTIAGGMSYQGRSSGCAARRAPASTSSDYTR